MKFRTIAVLATLMVSTAMAGDKAERKVYIKPGVISVEVEHEGRPVALMREQSLDSHIVEFFRPTYRGKIQPMHPFEPHAVETIGELDVIEYLQRMAAGDESILLIDSRTPAWVKRGTIPGSISIPFTEFRSPARAVEILEEHFDAIQAEAWDFSQAKTLVMFCNGIWCPQSPAAIRRLLSMGYPAAKIKYYRGGMQNWFALGLTVVYPGQ